MLYTGISAEITEKKDTALEILTDLTIYFIGNWTKNKLKYSVITAMIEI